VRSVHGIAAAGGLAGKDPGSAPHIILFPEVPFDQPRFFARVQESVDRYEYCVVVVSEGLRYPDGRFVAEAGGRDAFGHAQLGGVASNVAGLIKAELGLKYHYALADYLQRSARHIASAVDVQHAYAVGRKAVELALEGHTAIMTTIVRESDNPYRWSIGQVPLEQVANQEKMMPREFITEDGFGITQACRRYLEPLIVGEDYPPYLDGLPRYGGLRNVAVSPRLGQRF